jgi:hypothetical protein
MIPQLFCSVTVTRRHHAFEDDDEHENEDDFLNFGI